VPPQSCPSTLPQFAGPPGGVTPHVPSAAPEAMVHVPVQQSFPLEQLSPPCAQNDEAWHVPPEHLDEQHWASEVQTLPSVLHVVLSAAHAPFTQLWLQQSPFAVHTLPSDEHAG
jgi:hypothetical protein